MGLSSTTNRVAYAGDGSSTVFSFPYYFFSPTDLNVYLYNAGSSIVLPQTLSTNFTVSGNVNTQGVYPSGGQVVMNCAAPTNYQLIITRSPSPVQNYTLLQNAPINALALTQQLDYLTALVQRLQDEVARCIQLPDGLGTQNATQFSQTLPQNINAPANGNAPLVLNSGATGWSLGVVSTQGSSASTFFGTLPVVNGGTGNNVLLTQNALWYSASPTIMGQLPSGGTGLPLLSGGSSAPGYAQLDLTLGVMGALPLNNGGLGAALTPQPGQLLYFLGSSFALLSQGIVGTFLTSAGSSAPTWSSALSNPMTTLGDTIVGGAGGAANRLAAGTDNQVYIYSSSAQSAKWQLISGSSAQSNSFPNSTLAQMPAQTIKANSSASGATAQDLTLSQFQNAFVRMPTFQSFVFGSSTYTVTPGTRYVRIVACAAGGGGSGSATTVADNGGTGSNGGSLFFGTNLLVLSGGGGASKDTWGAGGLVTTVGSSLIGLSVQGGAGTGPGVSGAAAEGIAGGTGGTNPMGGGGGGGSQDGPGNPGVPGSGAGGGGAGSPGAGQGGGGGGAGAYADILMPITGTTVFAVSVPAGGGGGVAGTTGAAGSNGGVGRCIIWEY